ncbi:MAG: XRE family transcriptional regulator [Candidatus Omnitrophica bacterium CG11_big_fil_rev_8_21_14_0_20_42_13]|uniref:XRE family transcriptional regulator n=1 Tax=Candidatus Ghiorseimicrobium undicola TaxID=1974746 RepID=A0A2H0M1B2_9BACT|nr:MAG: XRE family transcriptional regulator [Candidatus Omnitrophica bacterium CG11_big_fil_rev_8_21_14_0_20_42_13]
MDIFYKKLSQKIKMIRERLGFSQETLAEKLGISRVAISQIENGDRKISAEEIANISKVFHITTDILLDLSKDIEVVLEKTEDKKPQEKPGIRISVPQKNLDKFKEILIYVLSKVGSKPNVGESVLYKLLYFIDFNYYEKYEEQLIGATYIKNHYGPTPIEFVKIVEDMEGKDLKKVQDSYFQYPQTKYLPLRPPDMSKINITGNEQKLIDDVINTLSDMNAKQISDYSHNDVPWQTTEDGEAIDYESVFYRTPPYSVRDYSDDDIQ